MQPSSKFLNLEEGEGRIPLSKRIYWSYQPERQGHDFGKPP
jgi:hypothetical protein